MTSAPPRERIAGALEPTPCVHSRTLSKLTGAEVFLKFENLQFTASFKERGALNKLLSLSDADRRRGVIAMSAGNHAQAVAYHAARLGIPATIVMPRGSPEHQDPQYPDPRRHASCSRAITCSRPASTRAPSPRATTWCSCIPTRMR